MADKIFIGIDPSLTATGWATHRGLSGIVSSNRRGIGRVAEIVDLLAERLGRPNIPTDCMMVGDDYYAVEGYSFASPYSAHQLGEVGGAIRLFLFRHQRPYIDVAPQSLKKFATGSGRAKKDELRLAVFKRWGKEFKTDHEVDAFILAKITEAVFGDPGPLNQFQIEVVKRCKRNLAPQRAESDSKSVKP